jgi:crotonobetainyl-CoA:carnitine CoA-transferase CaiB-like acyl-CoA transferase
LFDNELRPLLEEWARDKTRDEVVATLHEHNVPIAAVQNAADLMTCPQLRARRMVYEVDEPGRGRMVYTGNPIKMSAVPDEIPLPATGLGAETEVVLSRVLGMGPEQFAALRASGAVSVGAAQ